MGFTGSRRGAGQKFQKSSHEKAKAKGQRHKSGGKYLPEETSTPSLQEISDKTLSALNKLGIQIFALSPFRQYFDDWLVSLRNVLSEFESNSAVSPDESFVKERLQILLDVERELMERRLKESTLEESAKVLSEENHKLADMDAENATKNREFAEKRNADIQRLTKKVHDFEAELDTTGQMKTSFFGFTKKAKAKKLADVSQKLNAAKTELELAVQNFGVEQEKLHDEYEKKKQALIEKVQVLEKEISDLETDGSVDARHAACSALAEAVKALVQRKTVQSQ